ncbi:MAG: copper chaperone PCu(A)C [Sulfuricella sp.]|nr:copper chaperone PCu(A)C [Sulfuricella sp.]
MIFRHLAIAAACLSLSPLAHADSVKIDRAWIRATAPGQPVAGGFLDLTADADMKLLGGSSPVSASLELHTMKMDNGVMVMRQLKDIALPKGQTVQLRPGGLHIMFIGLKKQIKEGDKVPVNLTLQNAVGKVQTVSLEVDAQRSADMGNMHHSH